MLFFVVTSMFRINFTFTTFCEIGTRCAGRETSSAFLETPARRIANKCHVLGRWNRNEKQGHREQICSYGTYGYIICSRSLFLRSLIWIRKSFRQALVSCMTFKINENFIGVKGMSSQMKRILTIRMRSHRVCRIVR